MTTQPERVIDRNGRETTVYKRVVDPAKVRALPLPNNKVAGTSRIASTTKEEQAVFDLSAFLLTGADKLESLTVSSDEDGTPYLMAINGEPFEPLSREEIIAERLLRYAGVTDGVYKVGTLDPRAVRKKVSDQINAGIAEKMPQEIALYKLVQGAESASQLIEVANLIDDEASAVSAISHHPALDESVIDVLAQSEQKVKRRHAALRTTNPDTMRALANDSDYSVRQSLVSNKGASAEALEIVASNTSGLALVLVARHPNTPPHVLDRIAATSLDPKAVDTAVKRVGTNASEPDHDALQKSFMKENELHRATSRNFADPKIVVSDGDISAIAWRVAKSYSNPPKNFAAISRGERFSLQGLVEEAAALSALERRNLPYGLSSNGYAYANSAFLWARNKQGITK